VELKSRTFVVEQERVRVSLVRPPERLRDDLGADVGDPEVVRVDPEGFASRKNSLATSHCQIRPLYRPTSLKMCSSSSDMSWELAMLPFATPVVSQVGSWLCHKSLYPRTRRRCASAKPTRASAPDQLNTPCSGSTTCHFISVPGGHRRELLLEDGDPRGSVQVFRYDRGSDPKADLLGEPRRALGSVSEE
jgi:hypothetical protein